jgi:hypothetical protein
VREDRRMVLTQSDWPVREAQFRGAFAASPDSLPRTTVYWRWIAPSGPPMSARGSLAFLAIAIGAVAGLLRRKSLNTSPLLALWPSDAGLGDAATLIIEISALSDLGEGAGTVIGEFELNGAMCVEIAPGDFVWPTYNPRQPIVNPARR